MPQQLKTCRRETLDDEFFTMYKNMPIGIEYTLEELGLE